MEQEVHHLVKEEVYRGWVRIPENFRKGTPIWQLGYHNRWIRNAEEYRARRRYLESSPVAAR